MLKSDFSNYTGVYGRGPQFVRELQLLVEHAEQHPQTAEQLLTLVGVDWLKMSAALLAANSRTISSGPGGGPLPSRTPEES